MAKIEVNGAQIYYERHGSGHPLILIAGYTCDHTAWNLIVDSLSQHFEVITLDNRGIGQTKDDALVLSAELLARDIHLFSKKLGLEKPHILGKSMGGTIAQKLATTYPEDVGKLILLVTSAKWRKAVLLGFHSQIFLRKMGVDEKKIFETTYPWVFGEKFLEEKKNVDLLRKLTFENPHPQSLQDQTRQVRILDRFDGRGDLEKIEAPTFILYGKEDIISLPHESEYLAKKIANAKIKGLNSGHGMVLEVPEDLTQEIIKFL